MEIKVNTLKRDEFGRPSGVILLNKPPGITSHDLVSEVRKTLKFRQVGHAGALDRFSSGLMIILVGKATKLSDQLMHMNKIYQTRIILGVATATQDPEGKVTAMSLCNPNDLPMNLQEILDSFIGKQQQYVSLYSSVKVAGKKLRVLMRDERYRHEVIVSPDKKQLKLTPISNSNLKELIIDIPRKEIEITRIAMLGKGIDMRSSGSPTSVENIKEKGFFEFPYLDLEIACSKGTYIRQFAEDLGAKLNLPASLVSLKRISVGNFTLNDCIEISNLKRI